MQLLHGYRFWEWFSNNHERYERLGEIEEDEVQYLLDEANERLAKYCTGLSAEFDLSDPEVKKMIITANGYVQYFTEAEDLVMMAPKLTGWRFIALRPAVEDYPIRLEYEFGELSSDNLWYLAYDEPGEFKQLSVIVLFQDYDPKNEDVYFRAANIMLFLLLGEKSGILDVPYLQVEVMDDPDEYGILELETLPAYIEMRRAEVAMN